MPGMPVERGGSADAIDDAFPGWPPDVPIMLGRLENEARYFIKPGSSYTQESFAALGRRLYGYRANHIQPENQEIERMAKWKRYVVGPDVNGKSAVLMSEASNVQQNPGFFYRATLWSTREVPVDNTIVTDRAMDSHTREPFPGGMLFRALEIFPDSADRGQHVAALQKLNAEVKQKHPPAPADLARHPSMHRTDTLDCITCVIGEIYLVTDVDEALMRPGDSVVIRGTNHAWSNRSDKPCLMVGCMIDATPR